MLNRHLYLLESKRGDVQAVKSKIKSSVMAIAFLFAATIPIGLSVPAGNVQAAAAQQKQCFSFGCKDSVNRVQNKTNPFLFYAGALVYFHSHSLIFRFESLVGIVIKENSYFSDFSGRSFFVDNLLSYNLFRCF